MGTTPRTLPFCSADGAIEQAVTDRHRQPDDDELRPAQRLPGDVPERLESRVQQSALAEQIGAGVARDAQLGEQNDVAVGNLLQNPNDLRGVCQGIGNRGPNRGTGQANKTKSIHGKQPGRCAANRRLALASIVPTQPA